MASKKILHRTIHRLEVAVDRRRRPRPVPPTAVILPYRGFGRGRELLLRGRVVIGRKITRATEAESLWRNALNAYRRFESDELPNVRLRASYRDALVETVTNEEGYFQVRLEPQEIDPALLWHEIGLELAERPVATTGHAIIPTPAARFGVISDIDDTVVQTGATSLGRMIRSTMLENAASRTAFDHVGELYQAFHAAINPIFYVSSSPWNLYELLTDFMDINRIPAGPMFLQDFGIDEVTLIHAEHDTHKLREIQLILDYYPDLPFVLIGDSGQRDPEIYLHVIRSNPGRILVAYIRDVTHDLRDRAVVSIIEEARSAGVEVFYAPESGPVADHARGRGLIV